MPIWVKLPNLPFEFWSVDFFRMIGNALGTFLEADLSFLDSGVCCLGKVLVILGVRNGLAEDIVIKKGQLVFTQPLDYVGLPFQCNRCHCYGHLLAHCHLPFLKKQFGYVPKLKPVWRAKNSRVLHVDLSLSQKVGLEGLLPLEYGTCPIFF